MDETAFDRVARAASVLGSRRRLVGLGAALPLSGLLATLLRVESAAKRQHGRNRGHHPGKHKHKRKGQRGNNGGGGGGLGAGDPTTCLGPLTNLQVAVEQAAAGATLTLCAGSFPEQTLTISQNLTIVGAGSGQTSLTRSQFIDSFLDVQAGATVTVQGLTITGWGTQGGPAVGNAGTLTLADVVVTDSQDGGAVGNSGTLNLTQGSRITENGVLGIFNSGGGQVTIATGCTVTMNILDGGNPSNPRDAAGIFSDTGSAIHLEAATSVTQNFPRNCGTEDGSPIVNCPF